MNYAEHIEHALSYIEAHLRDELTLAGLARAAGYSEYHFSRVFKDVVKLTPADYIRKRRLSEIAREIGGSDRPVSEIAFEYGFNSKENFTRAFKAEHHILPTKYKAVGNSLKLYGRFRPETPDLEVTPKIVTLPGFTLVGFWSGGESPPNFWNVYNGGKLSKRLSGGKVCADYGVSRRNEKAGRVDYFIGIRDAAGDRTGAEELTISGGLYAVFATPPVPRFDFVNTIHRTWRYIFHVWMPASGYACAFDHGEQFETYVEESRVFSEDIYIPVSKKYQS